MNDGGPAFPVVAHDNWITVERGLSLLDYMAGQALAAFCCHTDVNAKKEDVAKWAYGMGEEMLAERARRYAAAKEATDAKA